jgi:hypothetical protein
VKFANFVSAICITRGKNNSKMVILNRVIQIAYIHNLRTSQSYIFFILQHLANNLCNFTQSKTRFLTVMLDFVFLASVKIECFAGIAYCRRDFQMEISSGIFIHLLELTRSSCKKYNYRAFAHDVTAAILVFQFKRIWIGHFCLVHQPPCFCWVGPWGMSGCKRSIGDVDWGAWNPDIYPYTLYRHHLSIYSSFN